MRKTLWFAIAAFLVGGAAVAQATLVDLYTEDSPGGALAGTGAIGTVRAQEISPTQAQNAVSSTTYPSFNSVAMHVGYTAGTESGTVRLRLYPWVTDYNTSIAQTAIGDTGNIAVAGGTSPYITLNVPNQSTTGKYLVALTIVSTTQSPAGLQIYGSATNDGGANNDSFNAGALKTDREYAVRLNVLPEPATMLLLALAAPVMMRRRRA